jgi:glycolate oxidase
MNGEVIEFGSAALDASGYDLLALVCGSEGLLGVITEVTVKLTPKAQDAKCVLAAFDDVAKAGDAVAAIFRAGLVPAGLEMMDRLTIAAVEPFVQAGYPSDAEAILLCESDGVPAEVEAEVAVVRGLVEQAGATLVQVSTSEEQRARFWSGRKAAFPAAGRISPDYYCMDGTIPRRALARVLTRIAELSQEFGLPCMNVFHAGDGNLHPLILYDANQPGHSEKTQAFGAKILELCVEVGGTITGEHGVGVEKIGDMCMQFGKEELSRFHDVKHAFDPEGLLNPGKAVPTLHRCAEMGRMHVHRGALPHPELPRF